MVPPQKCQRGQGAHSKKTVILKLAILKVNSFVLITLDISNNLMGILNHPMLQRVKQRLREEKGARMHSAGKWGVLARLLTPLSMHTW